MLLMLLVLPVDQDPIKWTLDDLLLRGTMYYKCLQGEPETSNKESVAIQFSKDNNVVNCEKLNCLMIQAAKGELDGTIK